MSPYCHRDFRYYMYSKTPQKVLNGTRLSRWAIQSLSLLLLFYLTTASNAISQANHFAKTYPNVSARDLDVQSEQNLNGLIRDHELVIR